jgi:NAD(P)-dependent dehydrogenase (short-subunit alcohol dehydrogenase family)
VERTVLVTGAGTGIGLATIVELARRGFSAVGGVRSPAKAKAVARAARAAKVKVRTVALDVTDPDRCEQVIADLRA